MSLDQCYGKSLEDGFESGWEFGFGKLKDCLGLGRVVPGNGPLIL